MEEFDDEDFSDLYADVELQASSAISAMHRLSETRRADDKSGPEIDGGNHKIYENDGGGRGGLRNLPVENGGRRESESEDDLDCGGDDGYKQKSDDDFDTGKYDNQVNNVELEVKNTSNYQGREEIEEDENDGDYNSQRKISDSVEDNHRELSVCDSDGMTEATETFDDTNGRKTSNISNEISSAVEPESSESGRSQHGRGPSCSPTPHLALRDKHIGKSRKYSKRPSSSLGREVQEVITREYHPSKDSKSRGINQGTRDDRYCERQRGITRKHSNQPRKYDFMPYLKPRWSNEDASYAIDVKRLYNRHVSHGKQRAIVSFDSNGNDMSHCSQSERFLTYSDGLLPDYHFGPAYLKNQYWNTHPSCRYKEGWTDGHNMSKRQNFLKVGCKALEDDWYDNQRRHPIQGNIEGSRKLTQKYSSFAINQRGDQFVCEEDGVHLRRTREDHFSPLHESDKKFVEENYRRICPSSGRDRDHVDHRCDRSIARDRREMEISGSGKRRCDSLNNSDNLWYTKTEVDDRRNIKHRPFPFYSTEEPRAPGRGQYPGASRPKSGVPERNMSCSMKEMHIKYGRYGTDIATSDTRESLRCHHSEDHSLGRRHYQQSSNTYIENKGIKDDRDEDHFVRRRDHRHSEVLHLREEVFKSRQQDDTIFHSEVPSYQFKRISRNNRADNRPAFGRVAELIDEREANRQRSKMMREEDCSNQFDGCRKSIQHHSHAQMHPRYQDSVDRLVVVGRKCTMQSSRRSLEAGEDKHYGRRDLMEWNDNQKFKKFEHSDDFKSEKAVLVDEGKVDASLSDQNWLSKFSVNQQNEFLDIEEGQIITEEIEDLVKCMRPFEDVSQINDKGHMATASDVGGVVQRLDDQKIQEIMVKMERRRERFKEPVMMSKDRENISNPLPVLDVETAKAKLERPARKRRWSGT